MLRKLLLAGWLLSISAAAQTTYIVHHIVFKNPGSFSQAQLEAAAGMHNGARANAQTMGAAAQKLLDSGYFDDVTASLDGTADDATLILDLKPTDPAQMLRVGFENFIWLKHEDIVSAIHAQLPLYNGFLPETGGQDDIVVGVLKDMLAAKHIEATVQSETIEPTLTHPERYLEYRVSSPFLHVKNVRLTGVTAALVPFVQKSVNASAGTSFNEGNSNGVTSERILEPILDAGYAKASLDNETIEPEAAVKTPNGDVIPVVVSATLHEGDIYRVAGLHFLGTPLISADTFAAAAKLHPGDIASRKLLLDTLEPIDDAYRRLGYMDVMVRATPTFDEAAHTVTYAVDVIPGNQYRVKQIVVEDITDEGRAAFNRSFTMKVGDLYNPEYVSSYLTNNTAVREFKGYSGRFKSFADPAHHTVSLVITFVRGGVTTPIR